MKITLFWSLAFWQNSNYKLFTGENKTKWRRRTVGISYFWEINACERLYFTFTDNWTVDNSDTCCYAVKGKKHSRYFTFQPSESKKRLDGIHLWQELMCGNMRGAFVWGGKGQRSGLLAAPLALYGPPEELLYVPRHIHGVVQVEVSVCVQYWVTPATWQMSNKATAAVGRAH